MLIGITVTQQTPTKHLNNYVQHTTFNQSSWDNFSISREVQEHKQMLNLLNEKMKRKMGLKTSNKMFNIENGLYNLIFSHFFQKYCF